ncbi:hypothetical protein BG000_006468 [Podila horticola]|nr:hypothetical protein BG000_006468 [Podila horticola]
MKRKGARSLSTAYETPSCTTITRPTRTEPFAEGRQKEQLENVSASSSSVESLYFTDRPTYAHIAMLVDISFLGIESLENMSQEVSTGTFEIEKARSNLASKIIELGMTTLHISSGAIWEKALKCGAEFDKETRDANQTEDTFLTLHSYRSIYEFYKDNSVVDESLPSYQAWCSHFMFLARKACDNNFIMYAHGISVKEQDEEMTEVGVSLQVQSPPHLQRVRSGPCLSMANTSPPRDRPADLNQTNPSPPVVLSSSSESVLKYLNNAVDAVKRFEEFLVAWHTGSSSESELDGCVSDTRFVLQKLQASLSLLPRVGHCKDTLQNIARIFRSMDTLRSFGSKLLDKCEKDHADILMTASASRKARSTVNPELATRRLTLLLVTKEMTQTLSELTARLWQHGKTDYNTWHRSAPKACPSPAKLSCARVDAILFLFRLHSQQLISFTLNKIRLSSTEEPILSYLESALLTARDMEDRESLPWISNAFYNFGGSLFKAGKQLEAVQPLQQAAVSYQLWLDSGSTRDTASSALEPIQLVKVDRKETRADDYEARIMLANRYEVLGVCYLALKNLEQAIMSFESGLVALPLAEFQRIETTFARDIRSCQLPAAKLLNRRTRTLLMQEGARFVSATVVSDVAEKLNETGAPIVIQGIIQEYECTLLSTLSIRTNQIKYRHNYQMEIMTRIISKSYRGGRALMNPIRRARVLISIATIYHCGTDQKNRDEAIHLIGEATELLKENNLKGDHDLEGYRNHYLAMAYSWHGVLDRTRASDQQNRKLKPFQIALQLWEAILSSVDCFVSWEDAALAGRHSKREKVPHRIPDPEQLFGHLQMLADCLGVIDDRVTQVQIYRLMLRLCNGVMPVDETTCADAVRIYVSMSQAYLALGYSGKAKAALNHGDTILKELSTSARAPMSDDQDQRLFETRAQTDNPYLSRVSSHLRKAEAKAYKALVVAEACLTRSRLLCHNGNLSEAISDCLRAVRQLGRVVGTLSKAIQESQKDSTLITKKVLDNPFLVPNMPGKQEHDQPRTGVNHLLLQGLKTLISHRHQWPVFSLLIQSLHQLSRLYLTQGCARESEYFLEEGKQVAQLSTAGKPMDKFMLGEAELGLRKHEWEHSQKILHSLNVQGDGTHADALAWEIQDTRIQLMFGDLYYATSLYDRSLQAYYRTEQILSHLMDRSVISELEHLVIREPQTPREKKFVTAYSQLHEGCRPVSLSSSKLLVSSTFSESTRDTLEQALFECVTLRRIKATTGYRTGAILSRMGQRAEGLELIEKSKEEDPVSLTAAEYHLAKARILMMELEDLMSKHLMHAMLPDSALSAGLFTKSRGNRMAPTPTIFARQQNLDDSPFASTAPISSSSPSIRVTRSVRGHPTSIQSPLSSKPRPASNSAMTSNLSAQRYMDIVAQAQEQLQAAYRIAIDLSPPHVVSDICTRQVYLTILESCFREECSDNSEAHHRRKKLALRASYHLEMSKAVTARREMHGLVKQKLNPKLPQEDQDWPHDILGDAPIRMKLDDLFETGHSKQYPEAQVQDLSVRSSHLLELEKPRRLNLSGLNDVNDPNDSRTQFGLLDVEGSQERQFTNRRAKNDHLKRQSFTLPSMTRGNERDLLQSLERAYDQDRRGYQPEEFQKEYVDTIPSSWTVVSMSMDVNQGVLYINRLRTGATPIVVRLPLNRALQRETDDENMGASYGYGFEAEMESVAQAAPLSYQDAVDELQDILRRSQETLSVSGQLGRSSPGSDRVATMSREDKAEWWLQRQRLDDRLCALLGMMEDQWLGGLKGIVQSHNTPADNENLVELKKTLEWIMTQTVNTMSPSNQTTTVRGRPGAHSSGRRGSVAQLEIDIDLCRVISHLGDEPTFMELKDLIYFLLDAFTYKNGSPSSSSSEAADIFPASARSRSTALSSPYIVYSEMDLGKIAGQIRDALRHYWLSETEAKNNGFDEGSHIVLILDKHLQMFPWESCPGLRGEAVSRLPSICFLRDRILQKRRHQQIPPNPLESMLLAADPVTDTVEVNRHALMDWNDVEIDPRRTFYVLNPGGDLKNTENVFREYVTQQPGWKGIIGRAPLDMECINGLVKSDLYVYFGHSGGEQYMRSHQIRQLDQCAVSLLLGCSSGSLKGPGEFDPTGGVMHFLLAGCPTVVANLWDVTDRDLDRFSKAMFTEWGLDNNLSCDSEDRLMDMGQPPSDKEEARPPRQSIVEAVKIAREECRLKYLVGAASVVYGIPCFVKQ